MSTPDPIEWPIPPVPDGTGHGELVRDLTAAQRLSSDDAMCLVVWRLVLDRLFSWADVPVSLGSGQYWDVRLRPETSISALVAEAQAVPDIAENRQPGRIRFAGPTEGATLTLRVTEQAVVLGYDRALVPQHTAEELVSCFVSLVDNLGAHDTVADARVRLRGIIVGRRPENVDIPRDDRSGADAFSAALRAGPDRPAVRHHDTVLSYAELAERAGGVAEWLRAHGIGESGVVATVLEASAAPVIAALGSWAVGAAYAHLAPGDPDSRITDALAQINADAVICDESSAPRLARVGIPLLRIADAGRAPYRPVPCRADDRAYLVFTSGSTGRPKVVDVPHRALVGYVDALLDRISSSTVESFGITTTFASDLGNTSVYGALFAGARLDVFDRDVVLDPVALRTELDRYPVDCLKVTPSHLAALATGGDLAAVLPRRVLIVGGESFPPTLARHILTARPDIALYNHYGPTETTIGALTHHVRSTGGERIPVGAPLNGVRASLVDGVGEPVIDGVPGMLWLGGRGLATGYFGDPAATDTAFTRSTDGIRWYRTGDRMLRNASGELEFLGRVDRQLKIRGHRVEPGEIEAALTALPGVADAVVTADEGELVAYVVASSVSVLAPLRNKLPATLIPQTVHLVAAIPLTANGKADLARLRAQVLPTAARETDAPRTGTEQLVAEIWQTVLKRSGIGRHEKFLEAGGDSLKSLVVYGKLRKHYPALTIATLFKHPSIAGLAAALDDATPADARIAPAVVEL